MLGQLQLRWLLPECKCASASISEVLAAYTVQPQSEEGGPRGARMVMCDMASQRRARLHAETGAFLLPAAVAGRVMMVNNGTDLHAHALGSA